jgi:chemosensory pili system protein ChpA (sensor histidine kinase/response regulator)
MVDTRQFNPLPLLSVKNGLDSSLTQISSELEMYFSEGWSGKVHLQLALDELHRSVGVLQMLSLEGLAVFSRELETVLQEMLAQHQEPSSLYRDTLRGAMLALTQYLDALADGASNTALRLFYSYQELHQLRGLESAFEVDLFFPEFGVELPDEVLNVPLLPSSLASVKKARAQYQRALLKWLRQDNPAASLRTMRESVQTVMACAPQDQQRAFWWIATGLLDCLIHDGLPGELNANKLLARIDLQMKSMLEQTQRDSEYNTTCNMQYMLARSHSVSETVDQIKQTYVLGSYLPEEQTLSMGEVSQVLEQMRSQLHEVQATLEHSEKGNAESNKRLAEQLALLCKLAEHLDRDTLQFACKQMHNEVIAQEDPEGVHRLKMTLAMLMVMLDYGIANYQRLGKLFHEQVRLLSLVLQEGGIREGSADARLKNLVDLYCQMEEHEVLLPLANEMKSNLQQVELILTVYFNDTGKRGELLPLRRLLAQVWGGFYILSLEEAKQLLTPVQQAVERYIAGTEPSPTEMHGIASAVSTLENYAHVLSQGQRPDTKELESVLKNLQAGASVPGQQSVAAEVAMPTGMSVREGGEDAELLEVFLEEAHEVLETLHDNLQICQRNPHSREALVIIRRGFHTLKGSGRMVGLTNLGEVAWAVEKALNKWLQDEKPITPSVLELIGDADVVFEHWIDRLRSGATALIDASELIAAAQRIESGVEEVPAAPLNIQPEEVEMPDIVIGGVSLSPILFNIATDEAANIIETLQRLAASLRKNEQAVVSYDFVRAAHTLTGVNRSTGFTDISDLAGALEVWLQDCMDSMSARDILQQNLLEQTINALSEMVSTLRSKQEPKPRPDLITRLQLKKKQTMNAKTEEHETSNVLPINNVIPIKNENDKAARDEARVDESETVGEIEHGNEVSLELDTDKHEEDVDLVAYVQRVAQDMANEPLQWQTPEVSSKESKESSWLADQNSVNEHHEAGIIDDAIHFDLNDIHHHTSVPAESEQTLQWQTPEVSGKEGKENSWLADQNSVNEHHEAGIIDDAIHFDLSDVHHNTSVSIEGEQTLPSTVDELSFDFDELGLSLSQQTALMEKPEQSQLSPVTPVEMPDLEPDFLSSLQHQVEELAEPKLVAQVYAVEPETKVQVKPKIAQHTEEEQSDTQQDERKRAIQDDLDDELLPIFLEEADELYPQLVSELSAWRKNSDNPAEALKIARQLQRGLHTLKGSARMAGAMSLGELTHRIEDCLDGAVASGNSNSATLDELENYFDRIGNSIDKLRSGEVLVEEAEKVMSVVSAKKSATLMHAEQAGELVEERKESALLRIRSDVVDDLVNEAGEISVARSRMEVELSAFKGGLLDLTGSVQGLRKLVREIEIHAEGQMQARAAVAGESAEQFDPLEFDRFTRFQELTRFMNESVHDVQTVQQTLLKNLDETSAAMSAQAKINTVLQKSLMAIRMLPFSSSSQRLYRIVRQTAKELGKRVNLELYGTEIELDRGVMEKMTAPFEHLLRNAIVHGLESPEQREAKGKPAIGNIALTLRHEGNEIVFEFKDDGAGLDTAKLRQKGVEQGLLKVDEVVSDERVMLLIFETGLSTAAELTEISGRGVGMDVVLSEIKTMGGRIEVSSEPDKGACFTIYLPLTLAVMKALMVRAGSDTYAIPSVMVEQVQQVKPAQLIELYQHGQAEWQNKQYPLHYLPRLLGDDERIPESKSYNAVLLLRSGEQRMALHLDELIGNKEVVVKNVGVQLARLPGVAGATVSASGKVVLILNPVPLAQQVSTAHKVVERIVAEAVRNTPVVMVVDDSLTVRKITTRLLTRVGYEVVTAKDGVDALEKLVDITPDVMLLDVEMPRMDGFELTKFMRRDVKTKNLPIIMITSRTAEKHRNFALDLGVNEYMGKPYQEEELLEYIARYAALPASATAH